MKVLLLQGIPLDSTYNYSVNTTDWLNTIAEYLGKTRAELVEEISSAPDYNFAFIDTINARCTMDLCAFGNADPVYTYAITYDGTNYRHWFIDTYNFVSSNIPRNTSVYDIYFSLNLIAEFNINDTQSWDCFVNKTHAKPLASDNFLARLSGENGSYEKPLSGAKFRSVPRNSSVYNTYSEITPSGYLIISTTAWHPSVPNYIIPPSLYTSYYIYYIPIISTSGISGGLSTLKAVYEQHQDDIVKITFIPVLPPGLAVNTNGEIVNKFTEKINNTDYTIAYLFDGYTQPYAKGYETELFFPAPFIASSPLDYSPFTQLTLIIGSTVFRFQPVGLERIKFHAYISIESITLTLEPVYNEEALNTAGAQISQSYECTLNWDTPLTSNEWKTYITQNKNYQFMGVGVKQESADIDRAQRESERSTQAKKTLVQSTTGATAAGLTFMSNPLGGVGQAASSLGATSNSLLDLAQKVKNEEFEAQRVDLSIRQVQAAWSDIQARPDKVKSLGYNTAKPIMLGYYWEDTLVRAYQPYGIIAYYATLPPALQDMRARDFFKYGVEANTRRPFNTLFMRVNFNYISLNDLLFTRLNIAASLVQKSRLNEIFTSGITFIEDSRFISYGVEYPANNGYKE